MSPNQDESAQPAVRVPRLVGRNTESDRLRAVLAGPPTLTLVEGEAGIGKTRLVREVIADRDRTMIAVCPPFRQAFTFGPMVDAAREAGPDVAGLGLSPLAGALRPLFPEWSTALPDAPEPLPDNAAGHHRLLRAFTELLDRMRIELLVLEDAHWADEATLELLLLLAAAPQRIGLLVTYRPDELPPGSLVRRLSARADQTRLTLDALDVDGTAELVSSMLDDEHVSTAFAAFLHDRTEGLPLAVEESVRLLRDRSDLVRVDGEWIRRGLTELEVPPTIRDAVLERVGRLEPASQLTLQAAAVLAEPAVEAVVAAVAGDGSDVDGIIGAIRSGLLSEDPRGRLAFGHTLTAHAVYEAIPGPQRRRLHAGAARVLRANGAGVARLAHHFRAAGETGAWCRYAEQAADLALASGDPATAGSYLYELLTGADLPPADLARVARKIPPHATGGHLHRAGAIHALRSTLDRVSLSATERGELRAQLGQSLIHIGEYAAAAVELERSIPDLAHRPVAAAHAMSSLGMPFTTRQPAATHRRWLDRAAAAVTADFTEYDRLALRIDRATSLLALGDPQGWRIAAELPDEAAAPELRPQIIRGALNLSSETIRWGRYAQARSHLTRGTELSVRYGFHRMRDMFTVNVLYLDWCSGAWTGLAERAAAAADGAEEDTVIRLHLQLILGRLEAATGKPAAGPRLAAVLGETHDRGLIATTQEPAAALAALRLAAGDVEEALRLTDDPVSLLAQKDAWLWGLETVPVRIRALIAAGRPDRAGELLSAFEHGLSGCDAAAAAAALAAARGECTSDPDAFADAAAAWAALPRPYAALLAAERRATCLLDRGVKDAALTLLTDVRQGLMELGAAADADRVAGTVREHGGVIRQPWRGGNRGYGDRLSPRELEVAALVADGLTTPEIARRLSRSPKTIATQLRSAMRKVGVSSRTALAVAIAKDDAGEL
ncbi:helix-turn-helix transcriptional regulator [Nakamurella lactea]|uniref:helix-turn-helix transcriptional regulator n=1 Tax=Nakamurella lactea TaxID=459515 RepID=UPI00040CA1A5|nr:LuxR family transcriptional regulator [Nakamurella lactea]